MMRHIALAAVALLVGTGTAIACDDHVGKCEIEDWKATHTGMMEALQIDGVATCDQGKIMLRLYDGEGDARKFLGVETAYIEGHIFQAIKLRVAKPKALSIRYSIQTN